MRSTIEFATEVLNKPLGVSHNHKYLKTNTKFNKKQKENLNLNEEEHQIIYTVPGQARSLNLSPKKETGVGSHPHHNSHGVFPGKVEVVHSKRLEDYSQFATISMLEQQNFMLKNTSLTQRKIDMIQRQFAHLSFDAFNEMLGIDIPKKRDFCVYFKHEAEENKYIIAYPSLDGILVKFAQLIYLNDENEIINLVHVLYEDGDPLVINQSVYDKYSNIRHIAHVGITGSIENAFRNGLERFDDGTVTWTVTDYKSGKAVTGTAVLFPDGKVELLKYSNSFLAKVAARNLGAEDINPNTKKWAGIYSVKACVPEAEDKYVMRREYKNSVRNQVFKIVDGAFIPGLEPIFDLRLKNIKDANG